MRILSLCQAYAVSCGHSFCGDCWSQYLTMKINEEVHERVPPVARSVLTSRLTSAQGQKSSHLTCMGHKCNVRVDESTVEKVLLTLRPGRTDAVVSHHRARGHPSLQLVAPETFEKYMGFLLSSYVDDHPLLAWCPAPGCGRAVKVKELGFVCPSRSRDSFSVETID